MDAWFSKMSDMYAKFIGERSKGAQVSTHGTKPSWKVGGSV
jgi:hypothetical protein